MASSQTSLSPAATPIPKSAISMGQETGHPEATIITTPTTSSSMAIQSPSVAIQSAPQTFTPASASSVNTVQQIFSTIAPAPQPTTVPQLIATAIAKLGEPVNSPPMLPVSSSKLVLTPGVVITTIHTQKMGASHSMSTLDVNILPGDQPHMAFASPLSPMTLIAIGAAAFCFSLLMAISIWSCFKRRSQHRNSTLSLPHTTNHPTHRDSLSPGLQKMDLPSPTNSGYTIDTTPHSKFCEQFDYRLPVLSPTHDPHSHKRYHNDIKASYQIPPAWGASQLDRLPSCPDHLTFVPKVLLTGNLLPPKPAVTPNAMPPYAMPLRFNHHDQVMIRSPPEPRSCKMSPAEASQELQKLIEQVDFRIYEDLDLDESLSESISNPELFSDLTGDSLPYGGRPSATNSVAAHPPLPLPRYNYRKVTRTRPSPTLLP
ncbi:uncharacterized protein PGTG_04868 [Puccinia graminis f. sp. tritici CRL 75-36-700-3]|uniref:Uncharacterized protein n=1 Tax=Puccinia graminis f. sp. tritici (strain CRL 75-36-700-3 / race SCCL) TaxID=418459 RepID=E3K355_PUCGT|nr:uncharacterized protein PGTG_04868 [Puccinia graminis f. sp. tritici CRL 75-36-700-3]EFP78912.1 hypothetical protein PGTG_04868 [Puccinia graminis f. sp. tritici CRL 75-36-700-3]